MAISKAVWQAAANAFAVVGRVDCSRKQLFRGIVTTTSALCHAGMARRLRCRDDLAEWLREGASDLAGLGACPPVIEYSREFQAQAAEELALLLEGSAVTEMLSDYAVMRDRSRNAREISVTTLKGDCSSQYF